MHTHLHPAPKHPSRWNKAEEFQQLRQKYSNKRTPKFDLFVSLLEERKEKQFRDIWRYERVFVCFTCMLSVLSGWMDGWQKSEWKTGFYRLVRVWTNPKSALLSRLNFHACLASAAPPPVFLWPNNSLVFLFFSDSFLFLSSSERFHASAHRRSLWEHQRSNSAAQQRSFCGLQGQGE